VDAGEPFVKATYHLEGDCPLVLSAYKEIAALRVAISNQYYPNTNAVATKLSSFSSNQSVLKQQLLDYGKVCVKAAYEYFHQKFDVDLKQAVSVFKQARFFNPAKIGELKPSCADIDDLKAIPGLHSGAILEALKDELPIYMATADGVSTLVNKLQWWPSHESELPKWSTAFKVALLIQPSTAAAERVFSLLSNSFTERQTRSMEDYIETSVMVQYNDR